VAEVDGRVVGNIVVGQLDNPRMSNSGRLGMAVHRDYWGQGVGSRLMQAMVDLADNWLNMRRIELGVHPDNAAAIRLYQKFGFEKEGRRRLYNYGDGRWADADFMARLRPF
jgi:putative acetyltransferase